MENFVFSLLYIQTQLAAAYLILNLALISLTLSRSLSSFHTLASHSVLFVISVPLVCGARCVLAQMKTVLARITMRLVSDARSNGRFLFQNDRQGGSPIRDYGTDSDLLDAYLELMNVQNQLLLTGLECLMSVFFLFPLSLFYTEAETRENAAQHKNVHASVQFHPILETEAEDHRPADNNNVHDDDILVPVQFPLTSGMQEQPTQDKNADDNNILAPVLFPSTSGTGEHAADDKNAHENDILVTVHSSSTSDVPDKPSSDVVPEQFPPTLETGTEEEQVACDKDVPVQLPLASGTEGRAADDKNAHENNILVPVHFSSTAETDTTKNADDNNISVAVHFPPTSEAALEDPIPDKPSSYGINSKKNLSAGTDLIPLSCSYGKLVHAVYERREMLVRKLKANNRLSSKVYTMQSKVCTIQVKMAKV